MKSIACMIEASDLAWPWLTSSSNKDKDKDVFIGPKEFVSHMMMTQTKDRLYHQLSTFYLLILSTMKVIQAYQVHTGSYMLFGIKKFDSYW